MSDANPWYKSIAELRAEVIKKHKATTRKISYNRTQKGVEISQTEFDPRTRLSDINSMNVRQLKTQLNKLNNFTERKNSFVPAEGGQPIPSSLWNKYLATVAKLNSKSDKARAIIENLALPRSGDMTIGERQATILPKNTVRSRGAVTTPHAPIEHVPSKDFTGSKAVEKMINAYNKKLTRKYDKERIARGRDEASQMLDVIGSSDLQKRLDRLSDKDFDLVWSWGGFAEDLSDWYEWFKLRAAGYKKDDLDAAVMDESKRAAIIDGLEWIESIKKGRSKES